MAMEKILSSIVAALIPFVITFISKRNKDYIRKNVLEEAQNHVNFISNYYDVSKKIIDDKAIDGLRLQLSNELRTIKEKVNLSVLDSHLNHHEKVSSFQKVFLTFKPVSTSGWLWTILFYLNFILVVFAFLGFFANEQNDFTTAQFHKSMQDNNLLFGMAVFILTLILFRWLALKTYKRHMQKKDSSEIKAGLAASAV